jgi:DNA-directed RNA polymerase subunit M/transcription elongation factor TFIIS
MEFCKACGSIMKLKRSVWMCSCGEKDIAFIKKVSEKIDHEKKGEDFEKTSENILAVFDHICSQCGHNKAQFISKGVAISDEDELIELKCGKCGHHDVQDGLKPY